MKSERTLVQDCKFIVCDVETTGLSPYLNRIIEISLVKIENGEITDTFSTLVNPEQFIPPFITAMTGIKNEDVINKPTFREISDRIYNYIFNGEQNTIFCGHNVLFDYKFLRESFKRHNPKIHFEPKILCTCKIARRLVKKLKSKSLSSVAKYYNLKQIRNHRAYDDAITTARILLIFLNILQEELEYEYIEDIIRFQNKKIFTAENQPQPLKRININLKEIPESPGVYFMKNSAGEILYIGKARNLKERISSYFHHNSELPPKIRRLLFNIRKLEFTVTNSELSALILESKLIKQYKPRFNTAIKRYRYHPFIKIDIQNNYPRIESVYEIENDGAYYYGPFSKASTVRTLLKEIYDKFKLRKCENKRINRFKSSSTCMYYDINKCKAPCAGYISKEEYRKEVMKVHKYLTETNVNSAQYYLMKEMQKHSSTLNFEKAAFIRDRLSDLMKVMSNQKVITSAINDKKLIIKCDNGNSREVFFIQNGKLINTVVLRKGDEIDQTNFIQELYDNIDYLYFSVNKYVKHKYTQAELDEIKVISNWLARTNGNTSYIEVKNTHTKNQLIKFILS